MNELNQYAEDQADHFEQIHQKTKIVVFDAILHCKKFNQPIPEWVASEISEALEKYRTGQVNTMDEALNIPKRNKNQHKIILKKQQLSANGGELRSNVLKALKGLPMDTNSFKVLKQSPEFINEDVSENQMRDWYRQNRKLTIAWAIENKIFTGKRLPEAIKIVAESEKRSEQEIKKWYEEGLKLFYS